MSASRRGCLHGLTAAAAAVIMPLTGCAGAAARRDSGPRPGTGALIRVGDQPGAVRSIAEAASRARDGDTIEIPAGDYHGDVTVWPQQRLTIRAVGGVARLFADGRSAEGKAIWVIRNGSFAISGFEFSGCRVADRNGAGIRFERGQLQLDRCRFLDNENGMLVGNDPSSRLVVSDCEFSRNGHGDGQSHNLYVGRIAFCQISRSLFTQANVGHLLKCRARVSRVIDNRLTDLPGGRASYELEFPNGGDALVEGNHIVQEPSTENSVMLSYGVEGYVHPTNRLRVIGNRFENKAAKGVFIRVSPGTTQVELLRNRFEGEGSLQGVSG